jgi:hypothetical protein
VKIIPREGKRDMLHWADMAFSASLYWSQIAERVPKIKKNLWDEKRKLWWRKKEPGRRWELENWSEPLIFPRAPCATGAVPPPLGPLGFFLCGIGRIGARCFGSSLLTVKCHDCEEKNEKEVKGVCSTSSAKVDLLRLLPFLTFLHLFMIFFLRDGGLALLERLALNSWAQVGLLPVTADIHHCS